MLWDWPGMGVGGCLLPTYGIILLTWAGSDRRKWGSLAQAGWLSPEPEWELERASPHRWKASRLIRRYWRVARAELLLLHLTGGCHRPYVSILGEGVGGVGSRTAAWFIRDDSAACCAECVDNTDQSAAATSTLQMPAVPKDDRSLLHRCKGHGWVANMDHRLEMSGDRFQSVTGKTSGRPRARLSS